MGANYTSAYPGAFAVLLHCRARGTFEWHEDPDFRPLPMTTTVRRFSATPGRIRNLGGASTASVLRELWKWSEELAGLRATEVI